MKMPKLTKPLALILIGVILLIAGLVFAAAPLIIPASGTINAPASLSATPNSINWGTLDQGQTVDRYVTLTNTGDKDSASLAVSAFPSIGTLVHNATGKIVPAHGSIIIDFRLTISASATPGPFNFDITITG